MFEILCQFVAAWLMADFLSGVFHWWEDRYLTPDMPLVGRWISAPNELHHAEPKWFLRGSYWQRNWTTLMPSLVAGAVCLVFGAYWWAMVFACLSQANEVHAWSHSKGSVSKAIDVLQSIGILQSPRHHAEHHRSPFSVRFCVMTDWLNPVLDATGFWRGVEWWLRRVFGIRVKP
jgi:ubiquitin-conjugating enzyme E2 variant